jgi:Tol biopolymer transport system component/DNA-binding winged helix-turn-helix (wHTH) protein
MTAIRRSKDTRPGRIIIVMAPRYRWDDFVLDLDGYRLERRDVPLSLEPKAFELLSLMVQRPRSLVTKQEIFDTIWRGTAVTDHALTRVIAQLRRVLGDDSRDPRYIETVPSKGYRWIAPVTIEPAIGISVPQHSVPPPAAAASARPVTANSSRTAGLAAALVLAVAAALGIVARTRPDSPGPTATVMSGVTAPADVPPPGSVRWPVQLTNHAGLDVQPDLSPLGDGVAYSSDRSGSFEIYVRAFGGTSRGTAITSDGGHNFQPAWSPDGRYLAYHSARHGGVWVVASRGGIPRQVAATGSNPAWSPDGRRIAFQTDEQLVVTPTAHGAQQGSTIWTVDPTGEHARELTRPGQPSGGHAAPAWSPDGRHLAFTVFEGGGNDGLWILRLDTLESRALLRRSGLFELAFAPDGSAVYVTTGEAAILRLPYDAASGTVREPHVLIPVAGVPAARGISIAADGRRAAFAGMTLSSQIWAQPVTREGLAEGPARALTNDTSRRNSLPAISPDGARVAYISRRGGEPPHVAVMDSDGGNGMQVTADESKDWLASWLPDSRRVAYLSRRGTERGLWAVDIATRREELLFGFDSAQVIASAPGLPRGELAEVGLAPSMTRAAFSLLSPPTGRRIVYVTSFEGFRPRAVTDGSISVGYPAWSPDESRLAVEIKDGASVHAGVVDVATGVLRRLTNERGQTWTRSWSPDGRKIVAAALRDGAWDLRWIDADTGTQKTVTPAGPPRVYVRYPEWSLRGDVIVFERGEVRGNIWTLELR